MSKGSVHPVDKDVLIQTAREHGNRWVFDRPSLSGFRRVGWAPLWLHTLRKWGLKEKQEMTIYKNALFQRVREEGTPEQVLELEMLSMKWRET